MLRVVLGVTEEATGYVNERRQGEHDVMTEDGGGALGLLLIETDKQRCKEQMLVLVCRLSLQMKIRPNNQNDMVTLHARKCLRSSPIHFIFERC